MKRINAAQRQLTSFKSIFIEPKDAVDSYYNTKLLVAWAAAIIPANAEYEFAKRTKGSSNSTTTPS